MKTKWIKKLAVYVAVCVVCFSFASCSRITKSFKNNQILRVDGEYVTESQAKVLLCVMKEKYESMFGNEAWSQAFGDSSLAEYVKTQVQTQLVQLASMKLLAEDKKISLSKKEEKCAKAAADAFWGLFSKEQKKEAGFGKKDVLQLYQEYALADKAYRQLTKSVSKEISDDQARNIDVQLILFKTYTLGEDGSRVLLGSEEHKQVADKAYMVWQQAAAGESFDALASQFNESGQVEYHIGRGEMGDLAFDEAAFKLSSGEMSSLVEGEEGIYIIKCISNYNQVETDANKKAIYEEECAKVFNKAYDAFMKNVEVEVNQKAWDKVDVDKKADFPQADFVGVYEEALAE